MPEKDLKKLLSELNKILDTTEELDPETRAMVVELEADIDRLLDTEDEGMDFETFREGAQSLQARFRAEYPTADRFLREIMDMLAKVGI
jgi:hypothetical protein